VTVYVDDVRLPFRNMIMCHMWADSTEELLAMADAIGVDRKWIQGHSTLSIGKARSASWIHFDIALSKKELALTAGAVLTDKYGPVEHVARLRLSHPDGQARQRAQDQLEWIATVRARR
jgi:pyrroloquinoline quinone (PQQ) biosynthesis protein C